ncbi:hypothetical protein C8035_v007550 [Colletotrichum spinosum]|uniref:Uncharacterized protein n=1 Tax=Colletotrichum spinosum TaxID=1347390 RepID=A0A4R8PZC5_9PEZI|nr:hypothetical protein C8035_v007550 [Colletotrichum spinosum]
MPAKVCLQGVETIHHSLHHHLSCANHATRQQPAARRFLRPVETSEDTAAIDSGCSRPGEDEGLLLLLLSGAGPADGTPIEQR